MSEEIAETPVEDLDRTRSAAPAGTLDLILEALLLSADGPLSLDQLQRLLGQELGVHRKDLRAALMRLDQSTAGRSIELREVASGWRLQVRPQFAGWVSRLWQEKPPRFSRALLETLALICYRQPVTRGEIEEVRGVAVSSNILRTLQERGWVREVGVKEVPGRPALFGTTHQFLDDFNLKSLDQLPQLPEIRDAEQLENALKGLEGSAADGGGDANIGVIEGQAPETAPESAEALPDATAVTDESAGIRPEAVPESAGQTLHAQAEDPTAPADIVLESAGSPDEAERPDGPQDPTPKDRPPPRP